MREQRDLSLFSVFFNIRRDHGLDAGLEPREEAVPPLEGRDGEPPVVGLRGEVGGVVAEAGELFDEAGPDAVSCLGGLEGGGGRRERDKGKSFLVVVDVSASFSPSFSPLSLFDSPPLSFKRRAESVPGMK